MQRQFFKKRNNKTTNYSSINQIRVSQNQIFIFLFPITLRNGVDIQALELFHLLKSKECFESCTHDVHFLGHLFLCDILIFCFLYIGKCMIGRKELSATMQLI